MSSDHICSTVCKRGHLTYRDIQIVEKVQRAATKIVHLRTCSYDDRLSQLGLTTLDTRRRRGDLIEAFKIMTDSEDLDKNLFFQLSTSGCGLRGHCLKQLQFLDVVSISGNILSANE